MKNYIRGFIAISMVCNMAAMAEEGWEQNPDTSTKDSKDFSIRIAIGSAPGINEVESDVFASGALNSDGGGIIEILAVKRYWSKSTPNIGGLFGGGIFFGGNNGYYSGGTEVELSAFGGIIEGGFISRAGNNFVFEITPYIGAGGTTVNITGYTEGTAPYVLYGIKSGAFILLGDSIELGLELGYGGFTSEAEMNNGFLSGDITYSGDGFRGGVVLSVNF